MKKIKRIMVLLVMLALSISAFVLPAQSGRVYANVSDLTNTEWLIEVDNITWPVSAISYDGEWYAKDSCFGGEDVEWVSCYECSFMSGFTINQYGIIMKNGEELLKEDGSYGDHVYVRFCAEGNQDLIDWLYSSGAVLQVEEPAQTGVVTDVVIPVVLALVVGTIIAFVVMDSKKVFVK